LALDAHELRHRRTFALVPCNQGEETLPAMRPISRQYVGAGP
jgi:hypothetical protein